MISKIDSLKKFGCFENFIWDDSKIPNFKKVNIFYGYNGSGKTTLSNLFYLLSNSCMNKAELASEYLLDSSSFKISSENEINEKNYSSFNGNLYVFNSKFVFDHIYDGSRSNMDSFGISAKITNETIDAIDSQLRQIVLRNNKLISWDKVLDNKLKEILESKKNEFNSNIQGKRLTNLPTKFDTNSDLKKNEKKKLEELYFDNHKFDNSENLQEQLGLIEIRLQELDLQNLNLNSLKELLFEKVNLIASDKLKKHINSVKDNLAVTHSTIDVNNWYIKGKEILKSMSDNSCPLCMTDIRELVESLIVGYDEYFNENLKTTLSSLDDFENQFSSILERTKSNQKKFDEIAIYLGQFKVDTKEKFVYNKTKLKKLQENILKLISIKRSLPNSSVELNIEANGYFYDLEMLAKNAVSEINTFIQTQIKEIEDLRKRNIINEIKDFIKIQATIEYNDKINCIFDNSKKPNSLIASKIRSLLSENEKRISALNELREKEISKLDAETRFVNLYLEYLGISKFTIKKQKDKITDNISIIYNQNGLKKNSLKFSLSEGEKTALAFAFFLSKIRAEQIEGGAENFENCTIVIDDPISSLDENRLFHTANLIDTFFYYNELASNKRPSQTFIFSHNVNFLKYISNIFHANENLQDQTCEYFIEPYTHSISKVPNGLKNFTTTYLEKLDEIIKFNDKAFDVKYENAKMYIPNYIRIVLESFLSFKLATVKEGSRERLPGLKFLIGKAVTELNNYDENIEIGGIKKRGIIERLNNLKKIADNESHGSISKIESMSYISEKELKDYCKHTLQIIKYFDEIHFTKVKQLMTRI